MNAYLPNVQLGFIEFNLSSKAMAMYHRHGIIVYAADVPPPKTSGR